MTALRFLAILPLFTYILSASAAPPPELTILRQQYEKVFAERVTAVHEAAIAELDTKFTTALDAAAATAKREGKLDDVLAIQADKKTIAEKQPLPAEDAEGTAETLKKLRTIYRDQFAHIREQRAANAAALIEPYSEKLQQLEVVLTQADRVEEAVEVRQYRETLLAGLPATPAAVEKSAPMAPGTVPTEAAAATAVKGDDRKAAEWILSYAVPGSDTYARVTVGGQSITCRRLVELPAGKFFIEKFVIDGFLSPLPRPISNEEMMNLAGLEELHSFQLNKIGITDDGLRFMATCPELKWIMLHNLDLTDECFQHLKDLKKLVKIDFNSDCPRMTGTGIGSLKDSPISDLSFSSVGFQDEAIPQLLGFKNLKALNLTGTAVTDAGIGELKALTDLTSLNFSQTDVTPAAVLNLKGLNLTSLSLGKPGNWNEIALHLPALAAAFPNVVETTLPRTGTFSVANLEPLSAAYPKLLRLKMTDSKFEPGAIEAFALFTKVEELHLSSLTIADTDLAPLTEMKSLEILSLGTTNITDAGLEILAGIKKLKTLTFKKTQVTPPALAAFKKARPDVEVK